MHYKGRLKLPDRQGKIPRIALAGPGQETAVDAPGQQDLLCLDSSDVGVEPPANSEKQKGYSKGQLEKHHGASYTY